MKTMNTLIAIALIFSVNAALAAKVDRGNSQPIRTVYATDATGKIYRWTGRSNHPKPKGAMIRCIDTSKVPETCRSL